MPDSYVKVDVLDLATGATVQITFDVTTGLVSSVTPISRGKYDADKVYDIANVSNFIVVTNQEFEAIVGQ
jgi:hypothetical protein